MQVQAPHSQLLRRPVDGQVLHVEPDAGLVLDLQPGQLGLGRRGVQGFGRALERVEPGDAILGRAVLGGRATARLEGAPGCGAQAGHRVFVSVQAVDQQGVRERQHPAPRVLHEDDFPRVQQVV